MAIRFEEWQDLSFKKALAEGKMVLLNVSASWCHYCHEMDRTTYSDPEVVDLVSDNFVPVRVDADRRPDVNARYNQGGWPSTVFLTPAGEVVTGATYLSSQEFLSTARRVLSIYREFLAKGRVAQLRGGMKEAGEAAFDEERIGEEAKQAFFVSDKQNFVQKFEEEVKRKFDPLYAGFGGSVKFPQPEVLRFCLRRYEKTKNRDLLLILTRSLEAYSEGALFDHIDGGFFRYSTDRRFVNPHFEKLLADNLDLAVLFNDAGTALADEKFLRVSEKTFSFIDRYLFADPFYFSSVDAERSYYEISSREERQKAPKPKVDRTVFTGLNARAASVLFKLGKVQEAETLLSELLKKYRDEQGLFYHFVDRGPSAFRLLCDQVEVLSALISIQPSVAPGPILELARRIIFNFYDEEKGGFFDRTREENEIGLLKRRLKPLRENVRMMELLPRLNFTERVERTLTEIFSLYRQPILSHAPLALFLEDYPSR